MKKETRDLAVRENKLLSRYKYFLKGLEALLDRAAFKKYEVMELKLAGIALKALGELLSRRPVFNFSDDIMALIVPYLSHRQESLRAIVTKAFSDMFASDDSGQFSLRVSGGATGRHCNSDCGVLTTTVTVIVVY